MSRDVRAWLSAIVVSPGTLTAQDAANASSRPTLGVVSIARIALGAVVRRPLSRSVWPVRYRGLSALSVSDGSSVSDEQRVARSVRGSRRDAYASRITPRSPLLACTAASISPSFATTRVLNVRMLTVRFDAQRPRISSDVERGSAALRCCQFHAPRSSNAIESDVSSAVRRSRWIGDSLTLGAHLSITWFRCRSAAPTLWATSSSPTFGVTSGSTTD